MLYVSVLILFGLTRRRATGFSLEINIDQSQRRFKRNPFPLHFTVATRLIINGYRLTSVKHVNRVRCVRIRSTMHALSRVYTEKTKRNINSAFFNNFQTNVFLLMNILYFFSRAKVCPIRNGKILF